MAGENAIAILRRLLIDAAGSELTPAAAEAVLGFKFTDADQVRLQELAEKSNRGTLTPQDCEEYDGYIAADNLLSLWKSKARQALKHQTSAA